MGHEEREERLVRLLEKLLELLELLELLIAKLEEKPPAANLVTAAIKVALSD